MKVKSYLKYGTEDVLSLSSGQYDNGRLAILAYGEQSGVREAVLSVNLPDAPLAKDEVFIKDWSENEGAFATLEKAGLVKKVGEEPTGFCAAIRCKWLGPAGQF